jgi:hypothetical protein
MPSSTASTHFWPNDIRRVISISMQFEAGGQPAKGTDASSVMGQLAAGSLRSMIILKPMGDGNYRSGRERRYLGMGCSNKHRHR